MNFVYLTTNLINGKKYVGSHTCKKNDLYLGSGKALLLAIKKYGPKNFNREILEECPDIISARKLEKKYISEFNTISPNGYNISPTGGCELGYTGSVSPETIIKIKTKLKGRKSPMKNKHHSEKTKILMSSIHLGRNHTEKSKQKISASKMGHIVSNDTKNKISESLKGNKCRLGKPNSPEAIENIKRGFSGKMSGNKNGFFGKSHSSESRDKISKSLIGRPSANKGKTGKKSIRKICEYCGKDIAVNIYFQHHGEKCKQRNI